MFKRGDPEHAASCGVDCRILSQFWEGFPPPVRAVIMHILKTENMKYENTGPEISTALVT